MIEFGWNFLYSIYFAHRTLQQCVCTILFVNIEISQLYPTFTQANGSEIQRKR